MQSSVCQRWDQADLLSVDSGAQGLLGREWDAWLLILVALAVVEEVLGGGVEAQSGGSDSRHCEEEVEAHPGRTISGRVARNTFQTTSSAS